MSEIGVDISAYQGEHIDFKKVRAHGVRFVLIKVSEGTTYTNKLAKKHAEQAKAAGLIVGAYHFLRPSGDHTAEAEVNHFFAQAHAAGLLERGCLRPVLDVEVTGLAKFLPTRRYVYRAITHLIKKMGPKAKKPFIYTGSWFWDGVLGARNPHKCPLWLAAYTSNPTRFIPNGWHRIAIHQYTDKGTVPGINGHVDMDRYLGRDLHMLRAHHTLKANH